ncbi:MAG: GTP cyclohydrolase I FolE [Oscillospiraceae bacterium]|nr:GTP cyclohydrolase I FolE [Oscillospiraceae bacterium]
MVDKEKVKKLIYELLVAIGEDPNRSGLLDTPRRVADMLEELCSGMGEDVKKHVKIFTDESHYDEVILVKDIPFSSTCEHHLLPFVGVVHIAYIPSMGKVIGLSKLARIVGSFSKRIQVQEKLTSEIADFINNELEPHGVAVAIDAEHTCMTVRGTRAIGSKTKTIAFRGNARTKEKIRSEIFELLN